MVAQVTTQTLASGPLYRRDGSMLQVASVPLPDGEVLLTYVDVSDAARVERVLRERNEALETAGRLKSEFVANVSYELRTPLNTVIGFGEILHNQYFGPLNASQREYSRGLLDSAHQLMALIDDTIDLASIEAGYFELERSRIDVPDMLQGVVSLSRERARSRGIDMKLCFSPDIGSIEGDERRLKQALFNLISNAIKFTPPGGAIRLEAERYGDELIARRRRHRARPRGGRRRPDLRTICRQQRAGRIGSRPIAGEKPDRAAWRCGRDRVGSRPRHARDLPTASRWSQRR